jgi:hypothetical protein
MPRTHFNPQPGATARCGTVAALAFAVAMGLAAPTHAAEAMRVVRDAVTGELRGPTAAEAAAFAKAEAALRASKGTPAVKTPVEITYPDGTVETKLDEDSMMFSVVRENGDGTLAMACLPAKEAKAFVKGVKKSSAKAEAKVSHAHQ